MTTLVIETLDTVLKQDFTLTLSESQEISAIKPYLYVNGSSSLGGVFTLSVLDESESVIASKDFTVNDLTSQSGFTLEYFHTWYPVEFENPIVLQRGNYFLQLSSSGYVETTSVYLAWVREHENIKNKFTYTAENSLQNPLAFELYEIKGNIR